MPDGGLERALNRHGPPRFRGRGGAILRQHVAIGSVPIQPVETHHARGAFCFRARAAAKTP